MTVPSISDPAAQRLWRVVLPVKGTADAKSRLQTGPGVSRADLARAMAMDTIEAATTCSRVERVVVVTSDALTASLALSLGAQVADDPGAGLDAAVRRGIVAATDNSDHGHHADRPVAVLLGDLPALTAEDLATALDACAQHEAAFVPDAEGTGTVLLAANHAAELHPAFGEGSAARHAITAKRLDLDRPRLRRDVDVAASLAAAVALGVGPRTAALLAPRPTLPG